MTPQAFSYPTLYKDKIYIAPYGLNESIDYMLVMDTNTNTFDKIILDIDSSKEKWQTGIVVNDKIYFLPYNESKIIVLDTIDNTVKYINTFDNKGKWICPHVYNDKIIALPYGEHETFNLAIVIDTVDNSVLYKSISTEINVEKKWHTTQLLENKIIGVPRGEDVDLYFPYAIEFNCDTYDYKLINLENHWVDYDAEKMTNKKFTTLAKFNNSLYAPPYSENPNFDILLTYKNTEWSSQRTNIKETSRKYYSHTVASNGKIFFPPAGHDDLWSVMLVIDGHTGTWHTKNLDIGKESKKYFTGVENSKEKIYYIPRGGCVCEPVDSWKSNGDLAEILVIDINTEDTYTIDISEYFKDSTTIEKYNRCVIKDDIIYAFPYGESDSFQTVLIFDTRTESVINTIDLNEI